MTKKSYNTENFDFNQLDLPINFKIADNFNDTDDFKNWKIRFHSVLGKNEEEVWSSMKIVKVLTIIRDNLFEGLLQHFGYVVARENNVVFEFTIADFPLMNLNDFTTVTKILRVVDVSKITETNKDDFVNGFAYIKSFLDRYYDYLAIIVIDLSLAIKKTSKVPQSLLKGKLNIDDFEDTETIHQPRGVVFIGKNNRGKMAKFLFQVCDIERYTNSNYTNLLIQINNCKKNDNEDKAKIRKTIQWYMEIRRELL